MKFNIDFTFIIAVLVLIQLFLLGSGAKSQKSMGVKAHTEDEESNYENEIYLAEDDEEEGRDLYPEMNLCQK